MPGLAKLPSVDIWCAAIEDLPAGLERLLTAEEAKRWRSYRHAKRAAQFLGGRALVKVAVAQTLNVEPKALVLEHRCQLCGARSHGKPRPKGAGHISFSVSHAGDQVVVAVSEGIHLGIDLEVSRNIDHLQDEILSSTEQRVLGFGLLRCWVRKEAVLKATGEGLMRSMRSLAIEQDEGRLQISCDDWREAVASRMTLIDLPSDSKHLAALAALDNVGSVRMHSGSMLLRMSGW